MTDVVCDASVVLKWWHDEDDVEGARRLLAGHRAGRITVWILDLTFYEIGNVLLRALGWSAREVAAQLDDLRAICPVLTPGTAAIGLAARLAEAYELTFYDAAHAAAAKAANRTLATADEALLAAGAGESAAAIAERLDLAESI